MSEFINPDQPARVNSKPVEELAKIVGAFVDIDTGEESICLLRDLRIVQVENVVDPQGRFSRTRDID